MQLLTESQFRWTSTMMKGSCGFESFHVAMTSSTVSTEEDYLNNLRRQSILQVLENWNVHRPEFYHDLSRPSSYSREVVTQCGFLPYIETMMQTSTFISDRELNALAAKYDIGIALICGKQEEKKNDDVTNNQDISIMTIKGFEHDKNGTFPPPLLFLPLQWTSFRTCVYFRSRF